MKKRCKECGTILTSLYIRIRQKNKRNWVKIEEMYCRKCKKSMLPTNWFNGE